MLVICLKFVLLYKNLIVYRIFKFHYCDGRLNKKFLIGIFESRQERFF